MMESTTEEIEIQREQEKAYKAWYERYVEKQGPAYRSQHRLATEADYKILQGGMPRIIKKTGRCYWNIVYDFIKGSPVVGDHRDPFGEDVKPINYIGNQFEGVDFNSRLVWGLHGAPCEKRSRSVGGLGYPRGKRRNRYRA